METLNEYLNYLNEGMMDSKYEAEIKIYKKGKNFIFSSLSKSNNKFSMIFRNNQFDLFQKGNDIEHVLALTSLLSNITSSFDSKLTPVFKGSCIVNETGKFSGREFLVSNISGIPFLEEKSFLFKLRWKSIRALAANIIFNYEGDIKFQK